jgi:5-methylcytosine-specific restriction endonuclease McrA
MSIKDKELMKTKQYKCTVCGKQVKRFDCHSKRVKNIFCSRACNTKHQVKRVDINCKVCNKPFRVRDCEKHKFSTCGKGCLKLSRTGVNNSNWQGGLHQDGYYNFNQDIKDFILKRDGNQCSLCGIHGSESLIKYKRKLSVHHIDYNKKNSVPENLITLCTRCNALVNFEREKWTCLFQDKIKNSFDYSDYLTNEELRWIGVDWDGTIMETHPPRFEFVKPLEGAVESLKELHKKGWKITIYTARPWVDYNKIESACIKFEIPFRRIICGKPLFKYMIDDRNIEFNGKWKKTLKKVK